MVESISRDSLAEAERLRLEAQELRKASEQGINKAEELERMAKAMEQDSSDLITLREAADMVGCSYRTLERWMDRGWVKTQDWRNVRGGWAILVRRIDVLNAYSRAKPGPKPRQNALN